MSLLTVKRYRPIQWSLAIIISSMLLAMVTWLILDKSHWSVIRDRISSNQEFKRLWSKNKELEAENERLSGHVIMLETMTQFDKETIVLVQNNVKEMQDKVFRLKQELEFYQRIMNSMREDQGLNIHDIHIESLNYQQNYYLNLVLTNVAKGTSIVSCVMDISIEGQRNGKISYLKLQDITLDESLELKFSFRNFLHFETNLRLPKGFVPSNVNIVLIPKGGTQSMVIKVFDWPNSDSQEIK